MFLCFHIPLTKACILQINVFLKVINTIYQRCTHDAEMGPNFVTIFFYLGLKIINALIFFGLHKPILISFVMRPVIENILILVSNEIYNNEAANYNIIISYNNSYKAQVNLN